jgi:predicted dehydrogenase
MFSHALMGDFSQYGSLVALCDINPGRLAYANETFAEKFGDAPRPVYGPKDFLKMIQENKVDVVIARPWTGRTTGTSCRPWRRLRRHHREAVTIDADKCNEIRDAIARTGRKLRVTFNYRNAPRNSRSRSYSCRA